VLTGLGLELQGVLGADEAAQAVDQPFDGLDIKLFPTAEGVDHLGLGKTLLGVPGVVGELDIFDRGAVFVLALDGAYVHAYLHRIYA